MVKKGGHETKTSKKDFYTLEELSELLGIDERVLRSWCERGEIACMREGETFFVDGSLKGLRALRDAIRRAHARGEIRIEQLKLGTWKDVLQALGIFIFGFVALILALAIVGHILLFLLYIALPIMGREPPSFSLIKLLISFIVVLSLFKLIVLPFKDKLYKKHSEENEEFDNSILFDNRLFDNSIHPFLDPVCFNADED